MPTLLSSNTMSNIIQFPLPPVQTVQTVQAVQTATQPTKFKVGKEYACTSIGDSDCIFRFKVLKRSAKFITLKYYNETHRRQIKHDDEWGEYCLPFGSYSMAPLLRAGRPS